MRLKSWLALLLYFNIPILNLASNSVVEFFKVLLFMYYFYIFLLVATTTRLSIAKEKVKKVP